MHQIRMILLVALLVVPIHGWMVKTSMEEFIPGDKHNMWLECRQNSPQGGQHRNYTVEKIEIIKDDANGGTTLVADIKQNNDIHTVLSEANFTVTGDILSDTSKFLRLTWSEVDVDDAGWYGCQVKGFDGLGNGVDIEVKSKEIKAKEFTIAAVEKLVQAIKDEFEVTLKLIQSKMEKKFNSELANLKSLLNGYQGQPPTKPATIPATTLPTTTPPVVTTTLPTTTTPVVSTTLPTTMPPVVPTNTKPTVKTTPKIVDDNKWPLGQYSIVGPNNPCPASHNSDVHNKWCRDYSNFQVVIASTDETLCYCNLDVKKSSRATWPRGRYCIETNVGCPTSFTRQYVDDPVYPNDSYCCRSDGSPSHEIDLPTKAPFYLFTDKSNVCQQVKGMNVTQTYKAYDTKVGRRFLEAKRLVLKSPRLCHYQPV